MKHCRTPERRADINSALERQSAILCAGGKPSRDLSSLIPKYGRKQQFMGQQEQHSKLVAWGLASSRNVLAAAPR